MFKAKNDFEQKILNSLNYELNSILKKAHKTNLECLFEKINLGKNEVKTSKYSYDIKEFSYENIFPGNKSLTSKADLNSYVERAMQEIEEIDSTDFYGFITNTINIIKKHFHHIISTEKEVRPADFYGFITNAMDIVKRYFWCVASAEDKSLSLYDTLKTKIAIEMALEKEKIETSANENKYLLIGGDISGIQKYIYALEDTEGVAKRLRARSFFIKLVSDVSSYKIIKELGLLVENIIISSGGKFYILAQNTKESIEKLELIKESINKTLYREYFASLFLNLEWIELNEKELEEEFSKKYDELNDKLEIGKGKKFAEEILENPIIERELYNQNTKVKVCNICKKELVFETEDECKKCSKDKTFGKLLPRMDKLAFYDECFSTEGESTISLFGIGCKIYQKNEEIKGHPFVVHYYGKEPENRNHPFVKDFYGGYTPVSEEGEVKNFEDLARETTSKNIGILKGDVDNLGLIFSIGLNDENAKDGKTSITRISTLSRMLDGFFSYWLTEHIKNDVKNSYYVVYAGGDDFMIVGPWDSLVQLSEKINSEFRRFTTENKDITLTCGVTITKSKDPIYFGSQWATEAEEKGKNSGKNGLVLFDKYIPWKDYDKVFELAEFINKNFASNLEEEEEKIYNQSFLYRLLSYTEMAEKYFETKNGKYLKYISDFTYDMARNIIPKIKNDYKDCPEEKLNQKIEVDERVTRLTEYFSIEAAFNQEKKNFISNYMRVILNCVVRKNREVK